MKRTRKVVDVLRCKDGMAVPIKQPRVVDAIRERDALIVRLRDQLQRAQHAVGEEEARRHLLLGSRWVRLGIALRVLVP